MVCADVAKIIDLAGRVLVGRSYESERCVVVQLFKQKLEVVLVERDVGVEASDNLVRQVGHARPACIEGMNLACKMALFSLGHADQFDPIVLRGITDRKSVLEG